MPETSLSLAARVPLRVRLGQVPGVAVMLVVLAVLFALTSRTFLTSDNLSNILLQSSVLLLLALPMTLIIMTEGLDLSVGAVLTLASLVLAAIVVATGSVLLGVLAAIGVGAVFGLANGWLVASQQIPPFVVTLGALGVAQGLALVISDGQSIVGMPEALRFLYGGEVLGVSVPILLCALAYGLFHLLLYHTRFGTYIPALGGNPEALKLAGVNHKVVLVVVYLLGGLMAGVGGLLMTARMNAGHPTSGIGLEFDAIAAVAVGGTAFEKGDGWLFGTLLGVLTIGVLRNGLNLLAVPSSMQVACVGGLVILALLIDAFKGKRA